MYCKERLKSEVQNTEKEKDLINNNIYMSSISMKEIGKVNNENSVKP